MKITYLIGFAPNHDTKNVCCVLHVTPTERSRRFNRWQQDIQTIIGEMKKRFNGDASEVEIVTVIKEVNEIRMERLLSDESAKAIFAQPNWIPLAKGNEVLGQTGDVIERYTTKFSRMV